MQEKRIRVLNREKQKVLIQLPSFTEILRGTFIKCYLKCVRPNCRCHQAKRYRHGPYYRVSYGKKGRMQHVYVPIGMRKEVKMWVDNYIKLWKGIEDISALNIELIRQRSKERRRHKIEEIKP